MDGRFQDEEVVLALARADEDPRTRPLMELLRSRVEVLRATLEVAPCRSEDLTKDCGGIACEIRGTAYLLRLAEQAKEHLKDLRRRAGQT